MKYMNNRLPGKYMRMCAFQSVKHFGYFEKYWLQNLCA